MSNTDRPSTREFLSEIANFERLIRQFKEQGRNPTAVRLYHTFAHNAWHQLSNEIAIKHQKRIFEQSIPRIIPADFLAKNSGKRPEYTIGKKTKPRKMAFRYYNFSKTRVLFKADKREELRQKDMGDFQKQLKPVAENGFPTKWIVLGHNDHERTLYNEADVADVAKDDVYQPTVQRANMFIKESDDQSRKFIVLGQRPARDAESSDDEDEDEDADEADDGDEVNDGDEVDDADEPENIQDEEEESDSDDEAETDSDDEEDGFMDQGIYVTSEDGTEEPVLLFFSEEKACGCLDDLGEMFNFARLNCAVNGAALSLPACDKRIAGILPQVLSYMASTKCFRNMMFSAKEAVIMRWSFQGAPGDEYKGPYTCEYKPYLKWDPKLTRGVYGAVAEGAGLIVRN